MFVFDSLARRLTSPGKWPSSTTDRRSFAFCTLSSVSVHSPLPRQPFGPNTGLTVFSFELLTRPMSNPPVTGTRRPRPSMASHLRDSDEPILISTTFPKKARPTEPPISLRTTSTSSDPLSTRAPTTAPIFSSDPTPISDRPLVGLLVKLNGEEIPFLIPRPSLPFRLPEAKP